MKNEEICESKASNSWRFKWIPGEEIKNCSLVQERKLLPKQKFTTEYITSQFNHIQISRFSKIL
jgi:hypothetical protein